MALGDTQRAERVGIVRQCWEEGLDNTGLMRHEGFLTYIMNVLRR